MIDSGRHLVEAGSQIGEPAGPRRPPFGEPNLKSFPSDACSDPPVPSLERMRLVMKTVEAQIIPRLVQSRRGQGVGDAAFAEGAAERSRPEEAAACVRLLLDPAGVPLNRFAEELLERGLSLDAIYLEVFAPAARTLGDKWERDECSFTDVTIALGRLQQALRRFSPHFRPENSDGAPWRQALFAAAPGEQHTFGLSMLVQYFLRDGWDATIIPSPSGDELLRLVQIEPIGLIGLSMSWDGHASALRSLIARLRSCARNPALRLIVGGVAFDTRPGLASEMGADGTAADALDAVKLARHWVL